LAVAGSLERLGRLLHNTLLPPAIQDALSELPAERPLLLLADDSELPWELLHDGTQHLALKHPAGRQLLTAVPARQSHLPARARRSFLFIANPKGDLPAAEEEVERLMAAFDAASERIDTRFLCLQQASRYTVLEALSSGDYDVIHYSGHAQQGALSLADGELTTKEIQRVLRGQPLVFLNACRTVKEAPEEAALTALPYAGLHARGLASAFILGGAAAFIGTLWQVFDTSSRQFAEWFYSLVLGGFSVGEALRQTRNHMRQSSPRDPIWASYVLYGDPGLAIAGLERRETRMVTVLVGRIAGLLPLFGTLGLEAGTDIQTQVVELLHRIAQRYEGQVRGPLINVLGVRFGIPTAHGDDAQRAILAAQDMVRGLQDFNERQLAPHVAPLGIQLGLSSGRVIGTQVQTAWGADYQIAGDIVDIAAGLANHADIDGILVDEQTRRLARETFTYDAGQEIALDRGGHRVKAFQVMGKKEMPSVGNRVVGRGAELSQLEAWWTEASAGRGRIVCIAGAAGVGKTRLVQAFQGELTDQDVLRLAATCRTYDRVAPHSLLAQIISALALITPEDDRSQREDKLTALVGEVLEDDGKSTETRVIEARALLGQTIGLPLSVPTMATLDPEARQRKLGSLLQALLLQSTKQQPLVVVLEDLQWADEASLTTLSHAMRAVGRTRLLVLATHRPEWSHNWTRWEHYRHLSLGELGESEQSTLLASLLEMEALPASLSSSILSRTGGNPLFIEEVVLAIQEQGTLTDQSSLQEIEHTLARMEVPDRVEGVIRARVDRLGQSSRDLLRTASVVGPEFEYSLLREVQDEARQALLDQDLEELIRRDLIMETGQWFPAQYAFRHELIHRAIYGNLLDGFRRVTHRLAAQALQRLHSEDESPVLERIALNYYQSDDRANSIRYCLRAAEHAGDLRADQTTLDWYHRAMEKIDSLAQTPPQQIEQTAGATPSQLLHWHVQAMAGKADVLVAMGEIDPAIESYRSALALSADPRAFPATHRADLYLRIAIAHHHKGDLDAAQGALQQGIAALDGLACLEGGKLLVWASLFHLRAGELSAALAGSKRAIALIQDADSIRDLAQAYNLKGIIHRNMGDPNSAIQAHELSISLYEEVGYLPGLDRAYTNLGCAYQDLGRWDETLKYFKLSSEISERTGEQRQQAAAYINLGEVYYLKGDLAQAIQTSEQARKIADAFGFEDYTVLTAINLGKSNLKRGNNEQAGTYLTEALTSCQQLGIEVHLPEILCCLAQLSLRRGQLQEALDRAQEALESASDMQHRDQGDGHRILGMVYREMGRYKEAEMHLATSLTIFEQQGSSYEAGLTLMELALLCAAQVAHDPNGDALRVQGTVYCDRAIVTFDKIGAQADLKRAQDIQRSLQDT
jgi:tetratricopeptide (TPR) repeat protein/class 3 adenylate cyclase